MSQWSQLRGALQRALAAPSGTRRFSVTSVPDRRKRNHLPSNSRKPKPPQTKARGNWDLFSSNTSSAPAASTPAAASDAAAAALPTASSTVRSSKSMRVGAFGKRGSGGPNGDSSPVFTNKFQNLLSFALEDAAAVDSKPSASRNGSKKPNRKPITASTVTVSLNDTIDSELSALGLLDDDDDKFDSTAINDDDGDNDSDVRSRKQQHKGKKSGGSASLTSSSDVVLPTAASPDKRKQQQLKNKKKKVGRSLLQNFQFENSLFDADDDLFGHVDWSEQRGGRMEDDREQRRFQRTERKQQKHQLPARAAAAAPVEVEIPARISVKDLADRMSVKSRVLIKALRDLGERGVEDETVLSNDIAELAVESLHMVPVLLPPDFVDVELTVPPADCSMFPSRPPIISVMGHVDHGKTTLLDALRRSKVAAGEAGGITQSIGAFTVELGEKFGAQNRITFIDTPGHAAFSGMRSRGSEVTDMIVLVVAADDGVRPQTVEVIQLAQKHNVPLVVAVTKCDMHAHDEQEVRNRVADQLLNRGVVVEQMGGDTPLVCVSSKTGTGLDTLKETIALHAEVLDLRADSSALGEAVVLEANVARGVGTQVDAVVKWGTLVTGGVVVCGLEFGKIRALMDESGKRAKTVGPGNPVRVVGLKGLPNAGDALLVVESEGRAKEVIAQRQEMLEWDLMATAEDDDAQASGGLVHRRRKFMGARNKWQQIELRRREDADEVKRVAALNAGDDGYVANVVPIIVKTDSVGVISAIDELVASLPSDEAVIKRIVAAVGPVSSSDLEMAQATGATIYAFNVKHPSTIDREALEKSVSIRQHRVVYSMLDDIKELLRDNLSGQEEAEVIGAAEVLQSIPITTSGRRTTNIAGCKITMGAMNMQAKYRLIRDGETVADGLTMESMRHFQEKVGEVKKGQECGLQLDGHDTFLPGDVLQAYVVKVVKRTL